MALSDIRKQIRLILSTVNGIGIIHEYQRFAETYTKFLDFSKDENNKINGWMISRETTPQTCYAQGGSLTRTHHFKIFGFYGLQDSQATELIFQDLIEAIVSKFNSYDTLNGAAMTCMPINNAPEVAGIQVDIVEPRIFGNVLCHYTELSLYPQENLN